MLFLRIIGIQISNILVSFNKLKEWIFERYEKISLSNEMLQTNVYKPWKSQDFIVLEGLFPSLISKTLQQ